MRRYFLPCIGKKEQVEACKFIIELFLSQCFNNLNSQT